ncbi:MAG: hypothetical protein L0177_05160 [Chloroflexi bacterium]|nr:hypothetical protein [Chloroflexota bacterium]
MGRSNWHYDHPPACTCAACDARRRQRRTLSPASLLRRLKKALLGRK